MKTPIRIGLSLGLALALTACGGKKDGETAETPKTTESGEAAKKAEKAVETAKKAEAVPTKKVGLDTGGVAIGGEKVRLQKVKFTGKGYEGEYNEALDSWTYEKWVPNADGGNDNVVRIYLDTFDSRPADVEAFAKKLQEKDFIDFGSHWPKIEKKEAFEGGWVIIGETNDGEDTEKAFAVRINKLNALCRGYIKPDAKDQDTLRNEAVVACRAAQLGE